MIGVDIVERMCYSGCRRLMPFNRIGPVIPARGVKGGRWHRESRDPVRVGMKTNTPRHSRENYQGPAPELA